MEPTEDGTSRILSSREYWNIAGRAGRAGAETEGTIIHVASNPYDIEDFNRYATQRTSVERVESALHGMLRDLIDERISSSEAASQLDPDLLALLVEESDAATDPAFLAETLSSSLFQIQARQTKTPIRPLMDVMTSTARRIQQQVEDPETRKLYASTGLSSISCMAISDHIRQHMGEARLQLVMHGGGDREALVDLLLEGLAEVREMEPRAGIPVDTRVLLSRWIDGQAVSDIADECDLDPQDTTEFIEDAFGYRLPWGISAYVRIATDQVDIDHLSPLASNIAGLVKYGVPSPEAAWAMTAGVASRRPAMSVALEYLREGGESDPRVFRRWLGRLDPESLAERLGLASAELESTARAVLRSQPNELLARLDRGESLLPLQVSCRPLRAMIESGAFYRLSPGDSLRVERDHDSHLNRNSIVLSTSGQRVCFLPTDAARAIAPEIDAGLRTVATIAYVGESPDNVPELRVRIAPFE